MRIPPSLYYTIGRFLLFIAIEAICIAMASNNGIVQQYTIMGKVRDFQAIFWKTGNNIKAYSRLKVVNSDLSAQNQAQHVLPSYCQIQQSMPYLREVLP